ncbi:sensor histidine kinase [Streptomyces polygonati]|uniref:histidine kinase n=1 Tax=Streptomyces polygonati TaxID=1617087 RepID=A0ABV8HKS9_9ACTN
MTYEEPPAPSRHGLPAAVRPVWFPALVLAFVQLIGSGVAGRHQTHRVQLDALGCALLLAGPALLLLRRRMPVAVAAATGAVTLLYLVLGYPYGPVFAALVVAFFSAVAAGHRSGVVIVAGVVYAGHAVVGEWLYRWLPPTADHRMSWVEVSGSGAWLLAVLAAAELFRVRGEQLARDRRERAAAERRRAGEERLRIARELHDVLAHSISVINVQSGVALALLDDRPEQARIALTTIRAASKEALDEVRQVLGALRAPGEAPRSPAPGLDRLPELVRQAGSVGLDAQVTVAGGRIPLAPGADLAAFRIVQEALTNVVRHSGSRAARIHLAYGPGALEVRIDDDGPAVPGGESGGGNGLVGIRERAAALGGSSATGPRPGGGFRVSATLPLGAAGDGADRRAADRAPDREPRPGPLTPRADRRPPGPPRTVPECDARPAAAAVEEHR